MANAADPLLRVNGLRAAYAKSQVLQGVSLSVAPGEIACLLGRNGVGKTTTLKSIIGLLSSRSGSVEFRGVDISSLPTHKIMRLGIGYVPEDRRIFPTLTVVENLQMGQGPTARSGHWSVDSILAQFPNLRTRAHTKAQVLSGGEKQMLTLGRAMVANPALMLIDEPTEGLAPVIVDEVERTIKEIAERGVGILLVESKLVVAQALAHSVYVMSKGEIVFNGSVEELMANATVRQEYLEV